MNQLPDRFTRVNHQMMADVKPRVIRRYAHYRPIGFVVTLAILMFFQLADMGFSLPVAALLAGLTGLLNIIFN